MPRLLRGSLFRATLLLFPVIDSRSTTLEVRLHRVPSQARVVLPLAPLALVARDSSAPKAWGSLSTEGFETPDRSPRDLLGKDLALEIPPLAHLDLGLRLGRSWLLESSLDGTSRGLEGAWAGVGKGFALRGAELTLRVAGGAQIVEAVNLYDVEVRRIRCLPDSCVEEDLNPTTYTDRTRTWEGASRLAASLQPSASRPWIDAQWIGPMAFARWVPLRTTTTTGETNSASSVATMSFHTLGGGWVFRGDHGQLVLGLRYLWGFRALGFTVQYTAGSSGRHRKVWIARGASWGPLLGRIPGLVSSSRVRSIPARSAEFERRGVALLAAPPRQVAGRCEGRGSRIPAKDLNFPEPAFAQFPRLE